MHFNKQIQAEEEVSEADLYANQLGWVAWFESINFSAKLIELI